MFIAFVLARDTKSDVPCKQKLAVRGKSSPSRHSVNIRVTRPKEESAMTERETP